jgi:hypothetical protein
MLRSASAGPSSSSGKTRTKFGRSGPSLNLLVIVGAALIGLGAALLALGLFHAFEHGTCSTTGYSRYYGPVPHCAKGIGWWMLLLFGGLIIAGSGAAAVVSGRDSDLGVTPGSVVAGLVLGGGGVAVAFLIAGAITSAIGPTGNNAAARSFDPTSITATDSRSMFHTANLRSALANFERRLGGGTQTSEFVIYPGYVNVIGRRGSNQVWSVLYVGGRYREDDSGNANASQPTFPLSQVDVTQPAALAQQLATYNHVPQSQLRYMVLTTDPASTKPRWLIYTPSGSPFTYTPSAGNVKSSGTSGTTIPSVTAATTGGTSATLTKAQSLANCITKAGSDPAKILACTGR